MLHFAPQQPLDGAPQPYAEALARLASIRHTLRLVDPFAGGPASDPAADEEIGMVWESSSESKRRRFDARSERVVASTAAGLEALLAENAEGREPNPAASRKIADEIRAGLADVSRLMFGRIPEQPVLSDALPIAL